MDKNESNVQINTVSSLCKTLAIVTTFYLNAVIIALSITKNKHGGLFPLCQHTLLVCFRWFPRGWRL